jgi:hypothetical protein
VVGLTTDGRLVSFDAATPGRTRGIGRVKGLAGDQSLVGIDYRVQDGKLYGVGNAGGVYTLLRHNLDDAAATTPPLAGTTVMDGTLTVPPATTPAMGIGAAAYTNNDLDPNPATTLLDLDTAGDQVVVQSPANAGTLAPTGKLLVDTGPVAGFDIYSRTGLGTTKGNHGFATLSVLGRYSLYQLSPLTGQVSRIGSFRPTTQVADIAIPLDQG